MIGALIFISIPFWSVLIANAISHYALIALVPVMPAVEEFCKIKTFQRCGWKMNQCAAFTLIFICLESALKIYTLLIESERFETYFVALSSCALHIFNATLSFRFAKSGKSFSYIFFVCVIFHYLYNMCRFLGGALGDQYYVLDTLALLTGSLIIGLTIPTKCKSRPLSGPS